MSYMLYYSIEHFEKFVSELLKVGLMALEHTPTMSVEEYFQLEENNPDTRYEYLDGYAYMMSGGSANHATISGNIYAILKNLLRGGPCRAYNSDMKVRVSEKLYFHPDVTVSCDARDRGTADFIQSPRIVVEVLSASTEAYDRGRKLQQAMRCRVPWLQTGGGNTDLLDQGFCCVLAQYMPIERAFTGRVYSING